MNGIWHIQQYRADIDGLRALAVFAVVAFHAFPDVLQGGFVGVDVFFVISGFLITSILIIDLDKKKFSFALFYTRRIKRIFPALLIVLMMCLLIGWFTLLTDEFKLLGKHVAAGAAFLSNIIYISESGYFDVAANTKGLLHLWSLGVEEQYYLLWPALVWACWNRASLGVILVALIISSFLYNLHAINTYAPTAFYSSLSRMWELLVGGLLAFVQYKRPIRLVDFARRAFKFLPGGALCNSSSILGLLLMLHSTLSISPKNQFPGWLALEPTIGTFLILFAGPHALVNRTILSNRILVGLGLISYPLYLWHWPLLVFARNTQGTQLSVLSRLAIILLSIGLGALTYRIVEKPVRFGKVWAGRISVLCVAMTCVGLFGLLSYGFADRNFRKIDQELNEYSAYFEHLNDHRIIADEAAKIFNYQCNFYDHNKAWRGLPTNVPEPSISPACYARHSKRSVFLWGDSFVSHLYFGLNAVLPKDVSLMLAWSSGCQIAPVNPALIELEHCQKLNHFGLSLIKDNPPDIVLLGSWNSYDIHYLRQIIPLLLQYGVKHVFVTSQVPIWDRFLYKIIIKNYWNKTPRYISGHLNEERLLSSTRFESLIEPSDPFEYIDLRKFFCNTEGCLAYLGEDRLEDLYTLDDGHLRPIASKHLAETLLAPLLLSQIRRIDSEMSSGAR